MISKQFKHWDSIEIFDSTGFNNVRLLTPPQETRANRRLTPSKNQLQSTTSSSRRRDLIRETERVALSTDFTERKLLRFITVSYKLITNKATLTK